jgi:hypothetical protein
MKSVFIHNLGEGAAGLVYQKADGSFAVYEISQYGGEEQHVRDFDNLDNAIAYVKSLA